ncbi:hypothetical protein KKB18_12390, partial [bacterium]|nr:hypothetical protein [bacterium]
MPEERMRILNMLKEGKISVEEAESLLDAIGKKEEVVIPNQEGELPKKRYKYLRVLVDGGGSKKEKV